MPDSVSAPKAGGQSRDVPAILQTEKLLSLLVNFWCASGTSQNFAGTGPMGRKLRQTRHRMRQLWLCG